jgi:putative SOS response-associated peptidase YedK
MCGRFAFYSPREAVQALFDVECPAEFTPRYNIAPTQPVDVLRAGTEGGRELAMLRWGLVPGWAKDPGIGNRLINARVETAAEKPAFRAAFRRRRCAVLADGFYEWQSMERGPKQPWFMSAADGLPFLMAGLWERWEKGDAPLETCTILTTEASDAMRRIHHRMPVILPRDALADWLGASGSDAAEHLLAGSAGIEFSMCPVRRTVNSPSNDGPELIEPQTDC